MADPRSSRWREPNNPSPFEQTQIVAPQVPPDQNRPANTSIAKSPLHYYNSSTAPLTSWYYDSPPISSAGPPQNAFLQDPSWFYNAEDRMGTGWPSYNESRGPTFNNKFEWPPDSIDVGAIAPPQSPAQERPVSPSSSSGSHGSGISYPPSSNPYRRSAIFSDQPSDALLGSVADWNDGFSGFPRTPAISGTIPPPKTDKPRPHNCTTCGRSFARLEQLKRHERLHTNGKPFKCPDCARCFSGLYLLRRHQKSHTTSISSFEPSNTRRGSTAAAALGSGRRSSI